MNKLNILAGILTLFFVLLLTACGGGGGGDNPPAEVDSPVETDIFASLRTGLTAGQVKCDAGNDTCCFMRCGGNNDILCVSRDPAVYMPTAEPQFAGCSGLVWPEWFYANDCFVLQESYSGFNDYEGGATPLDGPTYDDSLQADTFLPFIQCFCGRTNSEYSGESSTSQIFYYNGCDQEVVPASTLYSGLFSCLDECSVCQSDCTGKVCGSDDCNGSCGTCPSGKTCTAAGQCVDDGSGDTCSTCLSACRGLPSGCCTGCGCICESACGMCW